MDIQTEHSFEIFKFNKQIEDAILSLNWEKPTPIQLKAIPIAKAGKDILGIAQTGTGKTAAFLLPLMAKLHYPQGMNTRALVLAPTKELVSQLSIHFEALNKNLNLRKAVLVGGIGVKQQVQSLVDGNDIVFATPGRFLEIYQTGEWKVKEIRTLVIDEADRMMDMGFMPQIRQILEKIPSKRQNMLFSATFPEVVEKLSQEFLEFPERVEVSEQSTVAETIEQVVYKTPNFQTKLNLLLFLLKKLGEEESAMVFVKTKKNATEIGKFLDRKLPFSVSFLHANKGTNTRIAALNGLHNRELKVLVATDVAARGLDISTVGVVINFDLPIKYEEYVHRIGRTGRANRLGKAISFVDAADQLHLERTEKMIRSKISEEEIPANLIVESTPYIEMQDILKKIDSQKKKADPTYQGAFHEKKAKNLAKELRPKQKTGKAKAMDAKKAGPKKKGKAFKAGTKPRG